MPRELQDKDSRPTALVTSRRRRIAEALGAAARDSLVAMVDYGLNDNEIGRYYGLPTKAITRLRNRWGIDGQP